MYMLKNIFDSFTDVVLFPANDWYFSVKLKGAGFNYEQLEIIFFG